MHPPRPLQVLIVDDAPAIVERVRALVAEAGAEVGGSAGDGGEALREFKRLRPDAVVLDVQMPVLDGLAVLRAIRSGEGPGRCEVIVTSALTEASLRAEAMAAGADWFLEKRRLDDLREILGARRAALRSTSASP